MDAELQALDAAMAASAVHGWQVTLLDQIDGEPLAAGTGADRTAALLALTAALESR